MTNDEPAPLGPGARIGSYVVERELGAGAMATVFQVRHAYLDTVPEADDAAEVGAFLKAARRRVSEWN